MTIAVSKGGIGVTYKCYSLKYNYIPFHKKCPEAFSEKCFTCEHCRAEMTAKDATKLLNRKIDSTYYRTN